MKKCAYIFAFIFISSCAYSQIAASSAVDTPLRKLSVHQVQGLLKRWNLHSVLGKEFLDLSFDGEILSLLEKSDIKREAFPKALDVHWRKFWNYIESVKKNKGIVSIEEELTDKPDANMLERRSLAAAKIEPITAPSKGNALGYSGVTIKREKAMVAFGATGDVRILRSAPDVLEFHAKTFFFNGDIIHNGKNLSISGESFVGSGPCKKDGVNEYMYKHSNGKSYSVKIYCNKGEVSNRCPPGHEGLYVIDPRKTKTPEQMIPMYCSQGWHLIARNTKNGPYLTTGSTVPSGMLGVPSDLFDEGYAGDAIRKRTKAFKYSDDLWQLLIQDEGTRISDFLAAQGGTYSGKAQHMYVRTSSANKKWPGSSNTCSGGKHSACVVRWNYWSSTQWVSCNCNGHQTSEVAAYWDSNDEVRWAFTKGYGLYYKSSSGGTFANGDGNAWVK